VATTPLPLPAPYSPAALQIGANIRRRLDQQKTDLARFVANQAARSYNDVFGGGLGFDGPLGGSPTLNYQGFREPRPLYLQASPRSITPGVIPVGAGIAASLLANVSGLLRVTAPPRRTGVPMTVDWGAVLTGGFQALGQYATTRSAERVARAQARYGGGQQVYYGPTQGYPAPYGGTGPVTYDYGGLPAPTYAPGMGTQAAVLQGAMLPALPAVAGGAVALASPVLRSLVGILSRYVAPAAVIEVAQQLIASGLSGGRKPVYATASDNAVMGIMRGDLKAIRRVKRMGPKLTKALRSAGYGRRSVRRPATRRRRRAA